jgi:transcriptional regulator with XRE-family HTH domain
MDTRKKSAVKKSRVNPGDTHVAARVRSRRIQLGMSQTELGDKVGITFQQIQKYEKGLNRIGASRLLEIAGALGVRPEYFFDDPLAQLASQVDGMNINLFYEFLASSDRVALMQAFTRIKSKSLRHAIATLISDLKN